ncbi:DUF4974 domain-containing protein [Chitinophaga sp. Mgbs1]|uniref:DUF4974 domain-containing protein n=1 Tax=Chitinophaga solisilvae TaxID=1233460 RepID=A0A433WQE3_9BACT|nr:DUF4974 domain-containing protein [Chitinophaga solisilvae]
MKQHQTVDGYLAYNTDDFLADEYFQEWVKYRRPEADAFWMRLQELHPEKRGPIEEAAGLLSQLRFKTHTPDETRIRRIWENIDKHTPENNIRRISFPYKKLLAAACLILVITLGFWQWRKNAFIYKNTTGGETARVLLPDHSEVILNGNSRLKYAPDFGAGNKRELWIEGEAFFTVQHTDAGGKAQPFIVHSPELDVLVTGTAFNVYARRQLTRVVLHHGRVTIQFKDGREGNRQLQPGDMLEYGSHPETLRQQQVDTLRFASWQQRRFVFTNNTLEEVARAIEDYYGCKVVLKNPELSSYRVSAEIDAPDMASLDTLLSKALNIHVTRDGNTLLLQQ